MPEVRAALGVAVGAFLLHPHGGRQDQVGRLGRNGGVDVGNDDEGFRVAPAGQGFLHQVGAGLHVVGDLGPVDLQAAVLQLTALLHRVVADLLLDGAFGQLPDLFTDGAVFRVGDDQVRG